MALILNPGTTATIEPRSVQTRPYFANLHLASAVRLAKQAKSSEELREGLDEVELRAYVCGSIFVSIAFVESAINEIFCDAADGYWRNELGRFKLHDKLAAAWTSGSAANGSTLQKYQAALLLAGKPTFDPSSDPYQSMTTAIKLRNALIHYEPKTRTHVPEPKRPPKLEAMLRGKFAPKPDTGQSAFPHSHLTADCASWVVRTSWTFVDAFYKRTGRYVSRHPFYRNRLFREALDSL